MSGKQVTMDYKGQALDPSPAGVTVGEPPDVGARN